MRIDWTASLLLRGRQTLVQNSIQTADMLTWATKSVSQSKLWNSQSWQSQTFKLTRVPFCKRYNKRCGKTLCGDFSCMRSHGSSHFFDITFWQQRPNSSILIRLVGTQSSMLLENGSCMLENRSFHRRDKMLCQHYPHCDACKRCTEINHECLMLNRYLSDSCSSASRTAMHPSRTGINLGTQSCYSNTCAQSDTCMLHNMPHTCMHTVSTGCEHAQTITACQSQGDLTRFTSKDKTISNSNLNLIIAVALCISV